MKIHNYLNIAEVNVFASKAILAIFTIQLLASLPLMFVCNVYYVNYNISATRNFYIYKVGERYVDMRTECRH